MTWFDYLIIAVIAISALISLWRGFLREAFSLAVWVLAFWVAWSFFRDLAPHLAEWIDTPSIRLGLAFAGLMIVTLVVGGLVTFLLAQAVITRINPATKKSFTRMVIRINLGA